MIEEGPERAESHTLLEGLIRSYRAPSGGACSAAELLLIGLLRRSIAKGSHPRMALKKRSRPHWNRRRCRSFGYNRVQR